MISEEKINELRVALIESARPLIFFDDDPDGLCSFLQFYKLNPEAKGIIYKAAGPLDVQFLKSVEEYGPDKIFILDVATVTQEFLDKVHNVYWLDHHAPLDRKNVKYYNPMIESKGKDNRPTSYWASKITQNNTWLAMTGCVGDWFIPEDIREEFSKDYPDLLPEEIKKQEDALFKSPIGKLSRIFGFILKGSTKEAMTCVKILTRIKDPHDILDQTTSKGKFIWKKHLSFEKIYQDIKKSVTLTEDKLILYLYPESKMAMTSELSNEVLYENPDKFIVIGRERAGEMKCSLRSARYEVLPVLEKALVGVHGYGGGHLHACGANIKKEDFDQFIENIKKQL
jgi:hypothetical protein